MTRLSLLFVSLALALATLGLGCGGGDDDQPVDIETLFPADNAIGSWVEDSGAGADGIETADSAATIEALINGDAVPFNAAGFLLFARQHYTDGGNYRLVVRVYEMPDAATAASLYADLVINRDLYSTNSWSDLSIAESSRIANTNGTTWWINAHKDVFYFEVRINQVTADDSVASGHAESFASAIAAAIP